MIASPEATEHILGLLRVVFPRADFDVEAWLRTHMAAAGIDVTDRPIIHFFDLTHFELLALHSYCIAKESEYATQLLDDFA